MGAGPETLQPPSGVTLHASLPRAVSILGQRPARLAEGGASPGWSPPGPGAGTWADASGTTEDPRRPGQDLGGGGACGWVAPF